MGEHDRQNHDGAYGEKQRADRAQREGERNEIEFDEAALFLLLIDDVKGVDDRFHAGVRAPQRHGKPEDKSEAEFRIALGRKAGYLLPEDIDRPFRQNPGGQGEVIADRRSLANNP